MEEVEIEATCPYCDYYSNAATSLGNTDPLVEDQRPPSEHDITICVNCGEFCEYIKDQDGLKLAKIDQNTLSFEEQEYITHIKVAWRATKK